MKAPDLFSSPPRLFFPGGFFFFFPHRSGMHIMIPIRITPIFSVGLPPHEPSLLFLFILFFPDIITRRCRGRHLRRAEAKRSMLRLLVLLVLLLLLLLRGWDTDFKGLSIGKTAPYDAIRCGKGVLATELLYMPLFVLVFFWMRTCIQRPHGMVAGGGLMAFVYNNATPE